MATSEAKDFQPFTVAARSFLKPTANLPGSAGFGFGATRGAGFGLAEEAAGRAWDAVRRGAAGARSGRGVGALREGVGRVVGAGREVGEAFGVAVAGSDSVASRSTCGLGAGGALRGVGASGATGSGLATSGSTCGSGVGAEAGAVAGDSGGAASGTCLDASRLFTGTSAYPPKRRRRRALISRWRAALVSSSISVPATASASRSSNSNSSAIRSPLSCDSKGAAFEDCTEAGCFRCLSEDCCFAATAPALRRRSLLSMTRAIVAPISPIPIMPGSPPPAPISAAAGMMNHFHMSDTPLNLMISVGPDDESRYRGPP